MREPWTLVLATTGHKEKLESVSQTVSGITNIWRMKADPHTF